MKTIIQAIQDFGYNVEEKPNFKITRDDDLDFLIETDDLESFYNEIIEIEQNKTDCELQEILN